MHRSVDGVKATETFPPEPQNPKLPGYHLASKQNCARYDGSKSHISTLIIRRSPRSCMSVAVCLSTCCLRVKKQKSFKESEFLFKIQGVLDSLLNMNVVTSFLVMEALMPNDLAPVPSTASSGKTTHPRFILLQCCPHIQYLGI